MKSSSNGRTASVAPASERTAQETGLPQAAEPAVVAEVAAPAPADAAVVSPKPEPSKPSFAPISPGLSSVKLPLGPSPKNDSVSGLCGVSYHAACHVHPMQPYGPRRWCVARGPIAVV